MQILPFTELEPTKYLELYNHVTTVRKNQHYFSNLDEMVEDYRGETFASGENLYIALQDGQICGTIGMITREIDLKGEAFITAVNIAPEETDVFQALLQHVLQQLKGQRCKVKVGIPYETAWLKSVALEAGFEPVYESHHMQLVDSTWLDALTIPEGLHFEQINTANMLDLLHVSNSAFLNSPNGAQMTERDLQDALEKVREYPNFEQVAYLGSEPAIFISLRKVEEEGWIEALGVHPTLHGRGLAKYGLKQGVETLRKAGCKQIYLGVISSNERALRVYRKYGFLKVRATLTWLQKESD